MFSQTLASACGFRTAKTCKFVETSR